VGYQCHDAVKEERYLENDNRSKVYLFFFKSLKPYSDQGFKCMYRDFTW